MCNQSDSRSIVGTNTALIRLLQRMKSFILPVRATSTPLVSTRCLRGAAEAMRRTTIPATAVPPWEREFGPSRDDRYDRTDCLAPRLSRLATVRIILLHLYPFPHHNIFVPYASASPPTTLSRVPLRRYRGMLMNPTMFETPRSYSSNHTFPFLTQCTSQPPSSTAETGAKGQTQQTGEGVKRKY